MRSGPVTKGIRMTFRIQIASPPDRERVVAEIYAEERFVALVAHSENPENGKFEIEFPGPEVDQDLVQRTVDLDTLLHAVARARAALDR